MPDEDIKIAGATPSKLPADLKETEYRRHLENGNILKAKQVGKSIAEKTAGEAGVPWEESDDDSFELQLHRGILLAFSAVMTVESLCLPSVLEDVIKQEFYSELGRLDPSLYKETAAGGAFSFYYLAFRRGIDLERRVGQTFAMLCSHDGDPIYQEFGETLFCWMRSKTEADLNSANFIK